MQKGCPLQETAFFLSTLLKLYLFFPFPLPEHHRKRDAAELGQNERYPDQIQISKPFQNKSEHQRQDSLAGHGYVHAFFSEGKSLQRCLIDQPRDGEQIGDGENAERRQNGNFARAILL